MRFAIFSDIHGNLRALQTALRDAENIGCTHYACLGDIVGGDPRAGAQSKACIDLIRAMNMLCVKGNFELYCAAGVDLHHLSPQAVDEVENVREQLTEDDCAWLAALPMTLVVNGFTLVHATLNNPGEWGYVFNNKAADESIMLQRTPVCFFGHTHVPLAFVRDSAVRGGSFSRVTIEEGKTYFINVGSVGAPRPTGSRGSYVVYDLEAGVAELRHIDAPPLPPPATEEMTYNE